MGNLISGIFLMIEKPIKIGDQVEIDKISGFVTDILIISTLIRTYDGLLVRIPNQQVFTSNITNLVGFPVRRIDFTIGIRYSDDADQCNLRSLRILSTKSLLPSLILSLLFM